MCKATESTCRGFSYSFSGADTPGPQAEMALKIDAFVRPFRGYDDDLHAFWLKFLVAAGLQKWDTDEKKAQNIPLFLDSEAYVVWNELSDADKKDPAKIKAALEEAFSLTPAQAYRAFGNRKPRLDESVDGYAADLKRLLKLAGQAVASDGSNRVVIEHFIAGLPSEYARQVRMNADSDTIQKCVAYVRMLRSSERATLGSHSVGAEGRSVAAASLSSGAGGGAKFLWLRVS